MPCAIRSIAASVMLLPVTLAIAAEQPSPLPPLPPLAQSTRSLASFAKSNAGAPCFDRKKEPYTAVVDAHFHPRPFGAPLSNRRNCSLSSTGPAFASSITSASGSRSTWPRLAPTTSTVRASRRCRASRTTSSTPRRSRSYPHPNVNIVLSMTFFDLQNPEGAVDTIKLYDKEFPGMFKWAGELNVIKQALLKNATRRRRSKISTSGRRS